VAGYQAKLESVAQRQGPNYREQVARFAIAIDGKQLGELAPSKRTFAARGAATTEAALLTRGFSQLYISLGDQSADSTISVRIYHKPLVLLIWYGAVMMAFGGMLSLSDRRLRVGAPKPARASRPLQPAE
jgi:cytochrome c-type biogenesis protein CcmF